MVLLRTTYMECLAPTTAPVLSSPLPGASVSVERLSADNYLPLFRAVGDPLRWAGRTNMGPLALQAVLAAPATQIAVLRMHGQAAGFCEFDVMAHGDSELAYFGVIPGMQKKRLGPFLLDAALRAHWQQHAPRRIWLHTDDWDSPKAIETYQRAGFRIFAVHDLDENATYADCRAAIGLGR